jgi:hypothetical protein
MRLLAQSSTVSRAGRGDHPSTRRAFSVVCRLRRPSAGVISRSDRSVNRAANRTTTMTALHLCHNETEAPPLEALRLWFGEVARYGQLKYGAAEIIHAATSDDEHYEPFVRAIAVLLDHGAADGSLKKGLDPEDVLLQLSVLWRIDQERGGEARAERILDLIIDGLRAPGTQ